ncbi:nucleotidyl transferase AbiEii/AbiGii toxin family protein [Streptomyces indicus]|uniref:Nucleotidyl transferase AbiEii toxin, Type IV TA system n=1 Tax=Streptomyces indicus TaxID=417292 RepID=A0A1G9D6R6_9ACTN|nr:nucleotidyl transferase AbiEii/AbiGii toxin family protein [Streptomyces indicus]SDK59620.1 Nucleotidyl transferase AbiEii toxin, Type IV TA system [Streptomyces indicus]
MSEAWRRFSWGDVHHVPSEELTEQQRMELDLPRSLRPSDSRVIQQAVFEPAFKHLDRAFRALDPSFVDEEEAIAWRAARQQALHLVLAAVAGSPWAGSLVLRGSVLLPVWLGEQAREPGDLDFVVVPEDWRLEQGRTEVMLEGIAEAAQRLAEERGGPLDISARGAITEQIWTYDRVPGLRMVLPWSVPGRPGGQVQLDFVFNEKLAQAPEPVQLPGGVVVQAATPALSLAWKVMWLVSDSYPQGKDLYDAVLLAERCPLPWALLDAAFRLAEAEPYPVRQVQMADLEQIRAYVEWEDFQREYPQLGTDRDAYVDRLLVALAPTFMEAPEAQS